MDKFRVNNAKYMAELSYLSNFVQELSLFRNGLPFLRFD